MASEETEEQALARMQAERRAQGADRGPYPRRWTTVTPFGEVVELVENGPNHIGTVPRAPRVRGPARR